MHAATPAGAVGANIAALRKTADLSQTALAIRAGISRSYLQKIEIGDRACTPAIAAQVAKALGVSTAVLHGQPYRSAAVPTEQVNALRAAVRRYAQPQPGPRDSRQEPESLAAVLARAADLRAAARYRELLAVSADLVHRATAHAHAADTPDAWLALVDAYHCAATVAHRLGYQDLTELVAARQAWAAQRSDHPLAAGLAAWSEAGTFQSAGDYEGGLALVEQTIAALPNAAVGVRDNDPALLVVTGSLHLRAVTMASRSRDAATTRDHLRHAVRLADELRTRGTAPGRTATGTARAGAGVGAF